MSTRKNVVIGYKDVFEDYDKVSIIELTKNIPTKSILVQISFLLAQLHTTKIDSVDQIKIIKMYTAQFSELIQNKITEFINRLRESQNKHFVFINYISGLNLIETLLENSNTLAASELTPEQNLKIFKAYLISSQMWIDKQNSSNPNFKPFETVDDLIKVLIPHKLPMFEILEFKDFKIQLVKAVYFFEFCSKHAEFSKYLTIFLAEYGLSAWGDYLHNLISLYIRDFKWLRTNVITTISSEHDDVRNFLNLLCVNSTQYTRKIDYLSLREKPILKLNEENFLFLNLNFWVDKIYQGIQFDFARILYKHSATYKNKKITSSASFLGLFGSEFSETNLFYKVIEYAFENHDYKMFSGEKLRKSLKNGEPDYYIRDRNVIYIFPL